MKVKYGMHAILARLLTTLVALSRKRREEPTDTVLLEIRDMEGYARKLYGMLPPSMQHRHIYGWRLRGDS